jgi:hypothetical protein
MPHEADPVSLHLFFAFLWTGWRTVGASKDGKHPNIWASWWRQRSTIPFKEEFLKNEKS